MAGEQFTQWVKDGQSLNHLKLHSNFEVGSRTSKKGNRAAPYIWTRCKAIVSLAGGVYMFCGVGMPRFCAGFQELAMIIYRNLISSLSILLGTTLFRWTLQSPSLKEPTSLPTTIRVWRIEIMGYQYSWMSTTIYQRIRMTYHERMANGVLRSMSMTSILRHLRRKVTTPFFILDDRFPPVHKFRCLHPFVPNQNGTHHCKWFNSFFFLIGKSLLEFW